jgi:hypothetical protein
MAKTIPPATLPTTTPTGKLLDCVCDAPDAAVADCTPAAVVVACAVMVLTRGGDTELLRNGLLREDATVLLRKGVAVWDPSEDTLETARMTGMSTT